MRLTPWILGGGVLVLGLSLGTAGAFAQYDYGAPKPGGANVQEEIKTALTHAGFASKYDTLKEVDLHLHHVLNCLVGSKDSRFDAAAGNPCQGQGNGIVADLSSGSSKDAVYEARWAARIAEEALTMKTLEEAKSGAHVVALTLTDLQKVAK
jgi:hypothetical protein